MGSSSSKDAAAASLPSSSKAVRRTRSKGARVFQPSCLGRSFGSYDNDSGEESSDHRNKENRSLNNDTYTDQTGIDSDQVERECYGKVKVQQQASNEDDEIISTVDVVQNNENTRNGIDVNGHSQRNHTEVESIETRHPDRRIGGREPVERSVRFSRTMSVGRLRDRVLRRSSISDGLFGRLHEDSEVRDSSQGSGRHAWDGVTGTSASDRNAETPTTSSNYPLSSMPSSVESIQNDEVEPSRTRDTRYHDILERRTDFLERRRRIRSQVRALQRLGSRFENLSGHERSCILAGQHRTGHCSCRTNGRSTNPDDDNSARASISRIVMLAEALFEVLDEIHQQSVVLSSRPSVSSIGSVPAPKEVVESIPVKIYMKSQKHMNEEAAQCYICLVEYEEGDSMRILPCHHEFHQTCVDKWLKEIHRVCPLCRGDVCRSDSLPSSMEI